MNADEALAEWLRYEANKPTRALHRREPLGFCRSDMVEKIDGEWRWVSGVDGRLKGTLGRSIEAAIRAIKALP